MTRRLQAPQRRARRAAQRNREDAEPTFNLVAVAARSAGEAGMPARPWPGNDIAFLTAVLEAHHLPSPLIRRLCRAAAALPLNTLLLERLAAALADQIHFTEIADLLRRPALLLLGPPGAGKTTLAAKLAARLGSDREALLVSTDTGRPGGLAQLAEYAGVLGLAATPVEDAAHLRKLVAEAGERRPVIDTAGVATGDLEARDALRPLIAASGATPVLVAPADSDAEEAVAMVRFFAPLGVGYLLPTRLDLVNRLGGVLAAADAGRLALPASGTTPHFAFGLRPLTAEMLARRLLAAALRDQRSAVTAA
jgi:flagellar biosynthesis protein FlhF